MSFDKSHKKLTLQCVQQYACPCKKNLVFIFEVVLDKPEAVQSGRIQVRYSYFRLKVSLDADTSQFFKSILYYR